MEIDILMTLQGTFTLIYVLISVVISLLIISKYFKQNKIEILLVGIALLGLSGPWIPDAITFLIILFTGAVQNANFYLSFTINITIITTALTPISILSWLYVIFKFLNLKQKKNLLILFTIILVLFEILLFMFVVFDLSMIGTFISPFEYQWSLFTSIYYLSIILVIIITGGAFVRESLKSNIQEIRLKGKFLLIAIVMMVIGALIPYISIHIIALIISRLILVMSALCFYIGFMLPKWVENLFIKPHT